MRIQKYNEFFNWLKKDKKPSSWQEIFDSIWNKYLEFKNLKIDELTNIILPHANINELGGSLLLWDKDFDYHLIFVKYDNNDIYVINFSEEADPDEQKRTGMKNGKRHKITIDEYNTYIKKIKEISDWLDIISEKKIDKETIKIGQSEIEDIEISDFDMSQMQLDDFVNKHLKKWKNKKLEFETGYYLWTSNSSNEYKCEDHTYIINDFHVVVGPNPLIEVFTKDINGANSHFFVDYNQKTEYIDLSKNPRTKMDDVLKLSNISEKLTRQQERDKIKNEKYPNSFMYNLSPSKYESIEFIKELVELISSIKDQIGDKFD